MKAGWYKTSDGKWALYLWKGRPVKGQPKALTLVRTALEPDSRYIVRGNLASFFKDPSNVGTSASATDSLDHRGPLVDDPVAT